MSTEAIQRRQVGSKRRHHCSLIITSKWMTKILLYTPVSYAYKMFSVGNGQRLFVSWDFILRLERTTQKGSLVNEMVNSFLWSTKYLTWLCFLDLDMWIEMYQRRIYFLEVTWATLPKVVKALYAPMKTQF